MVLNAEKRRQLAVMAAQLKAAPGPSAAGPSSLAPIDQRLKGVAEVAEAAAFEDEDTYSGIVFKRKRKADAVVPAPSGSNGQAPSYREHPPSACSPRDIVVKEGKGESATGGDQGDSYAYLPPFVQKALHSFQTQARLESLEEDPLLDHVSRHLGEILVGSNLLLSNMQKAREEDILEITELKC